MRTDVDTLAILRPHALPFERAQLALPAHSHLLIMVHSSDLATVVLQPTDLAAHFMRLRRHPGLLLNGVKRADEYNIAAPSIEGTEMT